ncbi:MAG TPA: hypothetical protein VGI74_07745 [Streptosporangiaceae bacterium]
MTFSGNPDNTGVLAFARELEKFRSHLQWAACIDLGGVHAQGNGCNCHGTHESGHLAAAILALLDALQEGAPPAEAVQTALAKHQEMDTGLERYVAAAQARAQAEERLILAAECPRCGAAPGMRCKSTGESARSLAESHRARVHLARAGNGGQAVHAGASER